MKAEHEWIEQTSRQPREKSEQLVFGKPRPAVELSPDSRPPALSNPGHSAVPAVVVDNGSKGPKTQKDKHHSSACLPFPNQASSQHMQSCVVRHTLTPVIAPRLIVVVFSQDHAYAGIAAGTATVLCMNLLDLLKPQGQVPGIGAWARGRYRARHRARLVQYTCQRGLVRAVLQLGPECRRESEWLGTLLSLYAPPFSLRGVACFIGKEIWLHVEPALTIIKSDPADNQNAGVSLGSHSEWSCQPKLRPR